MKKIWPRVLLCAAVLVLVGAARALMDRALAQPRDDLDWLGAYHGGLS